MKINMEQFKPAEKPVTRPVKRFVELPGKKIKREPERYGGADAENNRLGSKEELGKD